MTPHDAVRRAMLLAVPGLGLGLPAFAQQTAGAVAGARTGSVSATEPVDLLDAWVDVYGRPTAKVTLNGQPGFRFMVDTGSNITVLAARHAAALGLTFQEPVEVNGTTGNAMLPMATINRLATGRTLKDKLRVAVLPDASMAREDGILGADVFAGKRLVFDIRGKVVNVEATQRPTWTSPNANMRVRDGLAEVDGKVGRLEARLMLDTGAQNCIVNLRLAAALQATYPLMRRRPRTRVTGVTGQVIVGDYLEMPDVRLGAVTVKDSGAVAIDAPIFKVWGLDQEPAMIVGVNVLSRLATFSIDYGAKMFNAVPMALGTGNGVMLG